MAGKKKPSVYSLALKQVQQANKNDQEQPAEQLDSQKIEQPTIQTSEHPNSEPVEHLTVQTEKQRNGEPVRQENNEMSKQQNSQTARQQRIKATFYLQPEDIIAIDEMQTKRFRERGKKPEKSELVSEAIQLLSKQ